MKQRGLFVCLIVCAVLLGGLIVVGAKQTSENHPTPFSLPAHAREVAPGMYHLGNAVVDGQVVEGIAFVDYRAERATQKITGKPTAGSTCYSFLASGAKWKASESWVLNPANTVGLDASTLFSHLDADIQKWETASGKNIFGSGSLTSLPLRAESTAPDGVNEIYFGSIADAGVIAVTIVWGVFSGPASQRVLVEWDQVYDQDDFAWSATGASGAMDFDNIATHELGHAFGMGHPASTCTEETMYAYADYGETKKKDLNVGDVTGIRALYK